MKEYLYCVPFDKVLPVRKNGIKYQCEKDSRDDTKEHKCDVCSKMFKDARCLKIHKTKMKHHQEDKSAKQDPSSNNTNKSSKRGRSKTPPSPSRHNKKINKT